MVYVQSCCFANQTYSFFDVLVTVRVGSTDLPGHGRGGVGWICDVLVLKELEREKRKK